MYIHVYIWRTCICDGMDCHITDKQINFLPNTVMTVIVLHCKLVNHTHVHVQLYMYTCSSDICYQCICIIIII